MKRKNEINDLNLNTQLTNKDVHLLIKSITREHSDFALFKNLIAQYGYEQLDEYWQKHNPDLTLLHLIAEQGTIEAFKFIIEELKVEDRAASDGRTSIHFAASGSNLQCLQYLLNIGTNINAITSQDLTPLMIASLNGYVEAVKILLKNGANIEAFTLGRFTSLLMAVEGGDIKIVKILLKNGANIEAATVLGITPLLIAICKGHVDIVKTLLEKGAKVDLSSFKMTNTILNENFDIDSFSAHLDDLEGQKIDHAKIKSLLLTAYTLQEVLSQDAPRSIIPKSLLLSLEAIETVKAIINNKINTAAEYNEINMICRKILNCQEVTINSMKSLEAKPSIDLERLVNSTAELDKLFEIVKSEIFEPLFGSYCYQTRIPKLFLLSIPKILSRLPDSNGLKQFFKDKSFAKDGLETAIKVKLLSPAEIEKATSVIAQLEIENKENSINGSCIPNDILNDEPIPDSSIGVLGADAKFVV